MFTSVKLYDTIQKNFPKNKFSLKSFILAIFAEPYHVTGMVHIILLADRKNSRAFYNC